MSTATSAVTTRKRDFKDPNPYIRSKLRTLKVVVAQTPEPPPKPLVWKQLRLFRVEMRPFEVRLWDRIVKTKTETCWYWVGATTSAGYGHLRVDGVLMPIHRYMYERFIGPIPEGLLIDHLCAVKICANPYHLEPVDMQENFRRGSEPHFEAV